MGSLLLPLGAYDGSSSNRGSQSGTTFGKLELEADFSGVYIWLLSSQTIPVDGFTIKVVRSHASAGGLIEAYLSRCLRSTRARAVANRGIAISRS